MCFFLEETRSNKVLVCFFRNWLLARLHNILVHTFIDDEVKGLYIQIIPAYSVKGRLSNMYIIASRMSCIYFSLAQGIIAIFPM